MPEDNEYRNVDVERLEKSFTHTNPPPRTEPPTNQQSTESGGSNGDGNSSTSTNS